MNLLTLRQVEGTQIFRVLAKKVDCSEKYLSQCAYGHRATSPQLAQKLVAADQRLTLVDLRPDVYGKVAA